MKCDRINFIISWTNAHKFRKDTENQAGRMERMKPVYERFIENPDFTKPDFVELIKCAEDPEAVRRGSSPYPGDLLWEKGIYQRADRIYQLL